jgi:hypothetical protein
MLNTKKLCSGNVVLAVGRLSEEFNTFVPVYLSIEGIDISMARLLEMSDLYSSMQVEAD